MHPAFKRDLLAGKTLLGFFMMYPNPGLIERIGHEWDWFWLDCQHGQIDYKDLLSLIRACDLVGKPAVVRVPSHDPGFIGRALDAGVAGIMVPQVESVAEARALVRAAKFPPVGNRSFGGRRVIDLHGRGYADFAADRTILIAQMESPEAIEAADGIAEVEGIDSLMPGPDDIILRRGGALDQPTPDFLADDIGRIAGACRAHGKIMTAIAMGSENIRAARANDVQLLIAGGDVPFLAQTSATVSRAAREVLAEKSPMLPLAVHAGAY